jgi:hypothetical protein
MIRHLIAAVSAVTVCSAPTVATWLYATSSTFVCPLP